VRAPEQRKCERNERKAKGRSVMVFFPREEICASSSHFDVMYIMMYI
jgi:hypothetical protein